MYPRFMCWKHGPQLEVEVAKPLGGVACVRCLGHWEPPFKRTVVLMESALL